jgi:hypothetical protein
MAPYFVIIAAVLTILSGCATMKRHREEFVIDCINHGGTVLIYKHTRKCIEKHDDNLSR